MISATASGAPGRTAQGVPLKQGHGWTQLREAGVAVGHFDELYDGAPSLPYSLP
jgi:hypothetical protein